MAPPASSELTMPIIYLQRLLEIAGEHGIAARGILDHINMDAAALQDERGRYSYDTDIAAISRLRELADVQGLGLKLGARTRVSDLGILGHALVSSADLESAINVYVRYQSIVDPLIRVEYAVEQHEACVTVSERVPLRDNYRHYVEVTLASWLALRTLVPAGSQNFSRVCVTWDEPQSTELFETLFQCPVAFSQPQNQLRFPAQQLGQPLDLANESVTELCVTQCHELLKKFGGKQGVVEDVRRELVRRPGQFPGLDVVAMRLRISPRTLRRRLSDDGTSFREVLNGVRMELAAAYLRNTHLSTEEVSHRVGYSEPTNFHRAFKQYFEVTPRRYRLGEG